jgi:two-component system, chemotaxis family, chemotaxis protein CheY
MGIRVLIVDDSATVRKIIHRCLQQTDLGIADVCEAGDGEEALELLANCNVDMVLTDINMPKMDGIRLLSAIKQNEQWKTIPVLMITAEAGAEEVAEAVRKGVAGFIRKPFTPMEIHDQLAYITATSGIVETAN